MPSERSTIRQLYRRRAKRYDAVTWIYPLFGVRMARLRSRAAEALRLKPGDTVVELGCGTGLNFGILQDRIGPNGSLIGVDLTDAMLSQARQRVAEAGWGNVELVEADLAEYAVPQGVDAVLSTFAMTLVAEYETVIKGVASALRAGGRLVILDLRRPARWPEWLVRVGAWLNKPYGVTMELADRHPWESVGRHLGSTEYQAFYFGAVYISAGERPGRSSAAV